MKREAAYLIAMTLAVCVAACSKEEIEAEPKKEYMAWGMYVNAQDTLPHIRYFDSNLVSLNDRCAVRHTKLNQKMPPVYVNGQPVGFC